RRQNLECSWLIHTVAHRILRITHAQNPRSARQMIRGGPYALTFIGQSNCLKVMLSNGEIRFEDLPTGLRAATEGDGEALLYFRPHDIELVDGSRGSLEGFIIGSRRVAGTRHLELDLGNTHAAVEIELPPERASFAHRSRIAFRPTKWRLFCSE
ncbi:TOBE-like domain-containing protein, partial [Ensifer sp. ENS10]|uniref:TOBE-like domain-containing protein n=1 Tax=Ensifer sp. ENS10 TaxID=2769286 RepID=UPI00177CC174